jgi:hypothetical protein
LGVRDGALLRLGGGLRDRRRRGTDCGWRNLGRGGRALQRVGLGREGRKLVEDGLQLLLLAGDRFA